MTGNETRRTFLDYFEQQGHRVVSSSSLIPANDPTLLFTNAGMNQFKDIFLGRERRDYSRAVTCQKCVRAGGKHNDLETVGRTARHHTFFEMLGNFSFGDYFKEEAIRCAWELVTSVYGIDGRRLYATVFRDDDEAFGLWQKISSLPDERILRFGEKDNFWAMGDTGPCGPCSEILVDLGTSPAGHVQCDPDCDCGRYLEIWNLVFMQFERDASGQMHPLPAPSIDTGMGLERIVSVLQGKLSNYDTDLFMPIIRTVEEIAGLSYGDNPKADLSLRILADHSRAGAFMVADGMLPSNEGRGYVLRKILRRAIRHGRIIGLHEPFIFRLAGFVAEQMGDVYPELLAHREYVARVIQAEEEKFSSTLDFGLRKLDEIIGGEASGGVCIEGRDIFKLYDTYGFPTDLLQEIADEKNWRLDMAGFQAELAQQQERARASWKAEAQKSLDSRLRDLADRHQTEFLGYDTLATEDARILAILSGGEPREQLAEGDSGEILLDRTPFYAESGGQIGDQGYLRGGGGTARVTDTRSPAAGLVLHQVTLLKGSLKTGERIVAEVDESRRFATACNHTATHLLQAALREVLGPHVKQAGSLVAPDRLRFDFSHFSATTPREQELIESMVNEQIWRDREVSTTVLPLEEAGARGAMALFGEKYQDTVRMVTVNGFSRELCGGTHLRRTGQMGVFKIVSESSIAAGVRRIEAVTGPEGYQRFKQAEQVLDGLQRTLRVEPDQMLDHLEGLHDTLKKQEKEIERLRLKAATAALDDIAARAASLGGIQVAGGVVAEVDRASLRTLADQLLKRLGGGVAALGAEIDGKASLVVMVSPETAQRCPAGKIVGALAQLVAGGGGGTPTMAEAGGKSPDNLPAAMGRLPEIVGRMV